MGTTLTNGVYLPNEGERNCYAGLKTNWEILDQKVADVTALQQAVAGALHREIVESLPTTDIDPNTIYMILSGTSATENVYNEFMYVNNAWELIGTSATDLTNYYTKAEVDGKLLLKASASDLTSHTGDTTIHVTASDKTKWTNSANTVVLRLAKTALTPSSSTNAFSNLDDSTALKVGDKVMDTAGVLFEVTAIDTANSTFTIGTALIDLAKDSDVVHTSGNETKSGELTLSDTLNSSDIVPIANNSYSSGSSNNQWNNIYSKNYYYNGVAWGLDKSNTWTGTNTFKQNITYERTNFYHQVANPSYILKDTELEKGSLATTHASYPGLWQDKNGNILGYMRFVEYNSGRQTAEFKVSNLIKNGALDPTGSEVNCSVNLELQPSGEKSLIPEQNNDINLGTATKKWKTFNGLAPSSLGMPDLANGIDISSYIDVSQTSEYTASSNGYISICGSASGTSAIVIRDKNYDFAVSTRSMLVSSNQLSYITIPVLANHTYEIICGSVTTIDYAKFYPCLGNV